MKTNNSGLNRPGQAFFSDLSRRISKQIKRFQQKDLFHKVAQLTGFKKTILNLYVHMSRKVRTMYMSQAWVASVVGCSREWANKCIQFLSAIGLLISKRRRYSYGWKTNIYGVNHALFTNSNIHELYTILSALRPFRKVFTQREVEEYNYSNSEQQNEKNPQKGEEVTDVMSWNLNDILALGSKRRKE